VAGPAQSLEARTGWTGVEEPIDFRASVTGAAMPRPWSEERKKQLAALRKAGRRPDDIAKALGLRRAQVDARLEAMAAWERNQALFDKAMSKRAQARDARAREAIAAMKQAIARGRPRGEAMLAANRAGATWREIGAQFGVTAQAAGVAARNAGKGTRSPKRSARKRGTRK
jgi:hypothetical protein